MSIAAELYHCCIAFLLVFCCCQVVVAAALTLKVSNCTFHSPRFTLLTCDLYMRLLQCTSSYVVIELYNLHSSLTKYTIIALISAVTQIDLCGLSFGTFYHRLGYMLLVSQIWTWVGSIHRSNAVKNSSIWSVGSGWAYLSIMQNHNGWR